MATAVAAPAQEDRASGAGSGGQEEAGTCEKQDTGDEQKFKFVFCMLCICIFVFVYLCICIF